MKTNRTPKEQKNEIIEAIHSLCKEKGLSEDMLFQAIEDAVKLAYRKNLPKDAVEPANVVVTMDRETMESAFRLPPSRTPPPTKPPTSLTLPRRFLQTATT